MKPFKTEEELMKMTKKALDEYGSEIGLKLDRRKKKDTMVGAIAARQLVLLEAAAEEEAKEAAELDAAVDKAKKAVDEALADLEPKAKPKAKPKAQSKAQSKAKPKKTSSFMDWRLFGTIIGAMIVISTVIFIMVTM